MNEYNVYIDESGDEGINRGSKYFILTALLINKKQDLDISRCVDRIKEDIEINIKEQLHWKLIKGYPNKLMIMARVSKENITIINIVIDTSMIRFIHSVDIYNHFSGYLFERICWFMRDNNAIANINISSRGNLERKKLIEFLKNNNNKFNIDYKRINQIKIYPNSQKKLLQLADCCCSALGQALKYNDDRHRKYISYLKSKLYSYNGKYLGYGLKYVPGNMKYSVEFNNLIIFLDKKNSEFSPD